MDVEVIITNHAYERANERLSLSRESFVRLAKKAYIDGVSHGETKGKLKKYLDKLWFKHKNHIYGQNNVRIYGENIYMFRDNILVTVYQLSYDLRKYIKLK